MKPFLIFPMNFIFKWYKKQPFYQGNILDGVLIGVVSAVPLLLLITIVTAKAILIPKNTTTESTTPIVSNVLPTPYLSVTKQSPTPTLVVTSEPLPTIGVMEEPVQVESTVVAVLPPTVIPGEPGLPTVEQTPFTPLSDEEKQQIINSAQCGVTTKYNPNNPKYIGNFVDMVGTSGVYKFNNGQNDIFITLAGVRTIEQNNSLYSEYERFLRESLASISTIFFPEGTVTIDGRDVFFGYLYDTQLTISVNEYLLIRKWATINRDVGEMCNQWFLSIK